VRLQKPYTPMYQWLGHVSQFEVERERPMLSALVVRAEDGLPGEGFARLAPTLGLQVAGEQQFWEEQRDSVFETWVSGRRDRLVETHQVAIADGRVVRVREYAGGPLRILVDDAPYGLTEAPSLREAARAVPSCAWSHFSHARRRGRPR